MRSRVALACALLLCGLLPLAVGERPALADATPPSNDRPNILLIIADDQAWSTFSPKLMPSVYSELVDQGVLFRRAYVNTSLCCPSRSQILTGLYEHDTGVDANDVSLSRPTIVQALHDQGYRTMLAGKYLNSWPCDPRPEFDQWACTAAPELSSLSLVDPNVNLNGTWQTMTGYEPDILSSLASSFIQQTPSDQPFFVMYSPTTPHLPADDPRYDSMPVSPPRGPAFDVNTMTVNAPRYARRTALTPDEIATSDDHYVAMAHAVRSFDDAINSLLSTVDGRSRDTMVIYLSDNGYLYGEHRRTGKVDPWEESVNVPMIVRYPAVLPAGQAFTSDALVQNVDIAPTIADLIHLPWHADGRSFLPVLERRRKSVRSAALIESCRGPNEGTVGCSGLAFTGGRVDTPGFEGIVTPRFKYVEYDDGSRQLVDLKSDPHELRDLSRARPALTRSLAGRLHAMMQPQLETTIATGPGPSIDAGVAGFTFFSPSRFATYRCRLGSDGRHGVWHSCPGGSAVFNDLAAGRYVFEVSGISETGRTDQTPARRAFRVAAAQGPEISIGHHPSMAESDPSVSFDYTSSSAGAGFQCRLIPFSGRAAWEPCDAAGTTYTDLPEGPYLFEVRARTSSDEVSDPAAGWFFRIDATGPTMTFSSAPDPATRRSDAVFRFGPSERIDGPITCTIDRKPIPCPGGRLTFRHLRPGEHDLSVTARDQAGNVGVTDYPWTIDRSIPKVTISSGPRRLSSGPVSAFNLTSSAGSPGLFVCSLDRGPAMPCFTAPTFYGLPPGHHTFTAWSVDPAGNRSAPARYRWTITA